MLKKIAKVIFSTRLTGILFVLFAVAMGVGTFLDMGQETSPTPYSRTLIYNAWWFEAIMGVFIINFIGNMFRYKLFRKEKWATLTLHLAFIFIILGAFITRYFGYEGMMSIREGATENKFLSQKTYVTTYVDGDFIVDGVAQRRVLNSEVDFSKRLKNSFKVKSDYNNQDFSVELQDFVPSAIETVIPDDNGEEYLKMVEAGGGSRHDHYLKSGQLQSIHNVLFTFNNPTKGAVNFTQINGELFIESPFEGQVMQMVTQTKTPVIKDSLQPFKFRSLYTLGDNLQFVMPEPVFKGKYNMVEKENQAKNDQDGIKLKISANGETKHVNVLGGPGTNNAFKQIEVGGLEFAFRYGPRVLQLPFSIKLNDFNAERYPGTQKSYSSFESKITVLDNEEGDFDFHIYMNNILNHRGYRFFQSSFDPDEKGTILSVNHDFWGTNITYLGYFLLYFGLMAILFAKYTRFDDIRNQLKRIKKQKAKLLAVLLLAFVFKANAQITHSENDGHDHALPSKEKVDSILVVNITSKEQAAKFGELVIQDLDGRMKPVNTYASELLRKLSKHDSYMDFNANQAFLSMQESPFLWYNVPIIYLKMKKADTIRTLIGLDKSQKYATLAHFFTPQGNYKLSPYLEEAYKAQVPTAIQKEFKEADQRVNLLYGTLEGRYLKLFPLPDDENNTWVSSVNYAKGNLKIKDTLYSNFIKTGFTAYLGALQQAKKDNNYAQADKLLNAIKKTQKTIGAEVMISDDKIKTEILYNQYDIFKKLFSWYMYAGTLMFILLIIQIFKSKSKIVDLLVHIFKYVVFGLFILHTLGLIIRWYISGHAPWSDAYESMIYVAWATMLFGLIIGYTRKTSKSKTNSLEEFISAITSPIIGLFTQKTSDLTIAAGAFVTSMILMIAHWNWMDPSIGNLQPVLNSYWLMIHVAIIVGSYGPFTLGMILGLVSLFLMILTNKENKKRMEINIKELTVVNEMALTVGLVMLTIGNFLGGMWANESWGRYWGWDPKETWALISIMVYAFVIHMRLIPGLRGRFGFNLASVIAFASIMMTYFGVNFYLAGLHSYAKDDQEISLQYILGAGALLTLIGVFAYNKYQKFYRKKRPI